MTQALAKNEPSASMAMPQGLLVPSQKSSKTRVRGWIRKIAQVNSYVLPFFETTLLGLNTPFQP